MRFNYQYRTKDNKLRQGTIDAASRDTAFTVLKTQGIRPSRMEVAPGFFNKLFGKCKRWLAIAVLTVALVVSCAWYMANIQTLKHSSFDSVLPRHQIYGEPVLMAQLERSEFAEIFSTEGERMLAWFAQPGYIHSFTNCDWRIRLASAIPPALTNEIVFAENDPREVNELKRIVQGMKEEIIRYLANGIGTPETYVKRLEERLRREVMIYTMAERELKNERRPEEFERRNASLRAIGLKTISISE